MERCNCKNQARLAAIVRGNDFTVEAHASVYDQDKGIYIPFDLSAATDVTISAVGRYTKAEGAAVAVSGNKVTARFSGALAEGLYGVEILFCDAAGRGRIFERDLFAIVDDSSEATAGTVSEGGSGDGLDISVDVRSRVVRIGRTAVVSDYRALSNKPSIGGVELDGDKTPAEFGLAEKGDIPASMSQLENDEGFVKAQEVSALLGGKVDKVDGKGLSTNDYTDADKVKVGKALTEHQSLGNYYTKEETNTKLSGYALKDSVKQSDWNTSDTSDASYIKNKPTMVSRFTNDARYKSYPATGSFSESISVSCNGEYMYSGSNITKLTITVAKTGFSKHGYSTVFQFSTGASPAITVTGVSWANSDAPTFVAGKTYEIHIIYNATLDKFLATYAVYE